MAYIFYITFFSQFQAQDIGESMYIHAFGAYFGLAVTFVLQNKKAVDHPKAESIYSSDLFSFIGKTKCIMLSQIYKLLNFDVEDDYHFTLLCPFKISLQSA